MAKVRIKKVEQLNNSVKWREAPKDVFICVHRKHEVAGRTIYPPTLAFLVGESCNSELSIKLTRKQYEKLKALGFFIV